MARFSVYLPDHLLERAETEIPTDELNMSALLRQAVETKLGEGPHEHEYVCRRCKAPLGADGAPGVDTP